MKTLQDRNCLKKKKRKKKEKKGLSYSLKKRNK